MAVDPSHIEYELLDSSLAETYGFAADGVFMTSLGKISTLFEESLGVGYYPPTELAGLIVAGGVIIAAYDKVFDTYVGAVTAFEMSCDLADNEWDRWNDPIYPHCAAELDTDSSGIVELESGAVSASARGHGIGTKLYRSRLMWAWTKPGVHSAVAYSWRSGKNESYGLHMRLGGTEGSTQGGMFTDMPCPDCGESCKCGATLIVFEKPTTDIDGDQL